MELRPTKRWHWLVLGLAALAIIGGITWTVAGGSKKTEATKAKTVKVVEFSAPPYCGNAIADAREILGVVDELSTAAGEYPELAVRAAKAGQKDDATEIRAVAARIRAISNDVKEQVGRIQRLTPRFDRHADACK